MNNDRNVVVYDLLMKVFRDNAYASIALCDVLEDCKAEDKPFITKLFYGVLERNVYYDYVIEKFAQSKPKKPIAVIVKMGYYQMEFMRSPKYAVVDNMVKLCKSAGKGGAAGFVNSALRNFFTPDLPEEGTAERLSVEFSYPMWLVKALISDYGYDFTRDMLSCVPDKRTHLRVNTGIIGIKKFTEKYADYFKDDSVNPSLTPSVTGYYATRKFLSEADKSDYVIQSAASVAAVNAYLYNIPALNDVLDLCAAPGGKAVLISSMSGAQVTACDVHKHRVELIRKYAFHCNSRVYAVENDATVYNPQWQGKYDLVICDVPCSGIGVAGVKPDILYNRSAADIDELCELQSKILDIAAHYVKIGGRLCYSTCTVLKKENSQQVSGFLKSHPEFARENLKSLFSDKEESEINLFPHINGTDGFYVAAMKKIT